ncbi:glycosyltransferase family 2 protein [Pseudoroseicyclus tamaricis]|uniref:Glycosyltransferase n=1 Tax=Pseudoroseicyclus tamaricis TaxID=2705421 RepID=A0A6B2JSX7_9RHOB|nr:glycosyltransferase family 2 protein [Pseudoroseicyclus tamaricis]NDV01338.1 glycosyltransferase [Pseudoroseicyclus tamaricis]
MSDSRRPSVSILMSNYCGEAYLAAAVGSVLRQTHRDLELLVIDDGSSDGSVPLLRRMAAEDPRLRVLEMPANGGPAAARNMGRDHARGDWIGIVDSDDLLHPGRIAALLAGAEQTGADMVADDMVFFGDPATAGRTLLEGGGHAAGWVSASDFVHSDLLGRSLGYLKPLIRREAWGDVRYDEELRIGEDFDLCLRLLLGGARYKLLPSPTYLYRRHASSISHRLSTEAIAGMIRSHDATVGMAERVEPREALLGQMLERRGRVLQRRLAYETLVATIKARSAGSAGLQLMARPAMVVDLGRSFLENRARRRQQAGEAPAEASPVTLVLATDGKLGKTPAPEEAVRIPLPPGLPEAATLGEQRRLAQRLARLHAEASLDVIAVGPEGRAALGYLPGWRKARLLVDEDEAHGHDLPEDCALEVAPA